MGVPSGWASYVFAPLVAFTAVGVLALLLRWAFGHGTSLVAHPVRPGPPDDYGLLVPVAAPADDAAGEAVRQRLADHGVRVTLARTSDGPRVLVFPDDVDLARRLLGGGGGQASK